MLFVGACQIRLHLPASQSLKDTRQVVKSVLARVRERFALATAEIGDLEAWQVATLGLAGVSNAANHLEDVLRHAVRYIEESRPDLDVMDVRIETQRFCD